MADGRIVIDVIMEDGSIKQGVASIDNISSASDKAGLSLKNMVGAGLLIKGVSAAMGVLKSSVGSAVERFDTLQKFPKVMESLGFNTDQSAKASKRLSDGIDGLPTTLQEVVANTQRMTAITGDLDKSTDATIAMNNAFLASGASTDAASRGMDQYMKMVSTGKVELDSWTTLQETMPLALQKTAEAMGFVGKTAQNDLYSALKSGTVTFDQFQDKLIELGTGTGQLADLAKKNSLGIGTSFKNLQSSITKGLANVLTKFDEIVQKLSGKSIAQNIDSLKGIINSTFAAIVSSMDRALPVLGTIGKAFSVMATYIKPILPIVGALSVGLITFVAVSATMSKVVSMFNLIKTSFMTLRVAMLANPFALVVAGIVALIGVTAHFYKTNENVKKTLDNVFASLKNLMAPINNLVKGLGILGTAFVSLVKDGPGPHIAELRKQFIELLPESVWNKMSQLVGVINQVKAAFQGVIGIVTGSVKSFGDLDGVLGGTFGIKGTQNIMNIGNAVKNVIENIKNLVKGIGILSTAFVELVTSGPGPHLVELREKFLQLLPESVWNKMVSFVSVINQVKTAISGVTGIIIGSVKSFDDLDAVLMGNFGEKGTQNIMNIGNALKNVISEVKNFASVAAQTFSGFANNVKETFVNLPSVISSAMGNIGSPMDIIKDRITSTINTIKTVIDTLSPAFLTVFNGIKGFVGNFISSFSNATSSFGSNVGQIISFLSMFTGPIGMISFLFKNFGSEIGTIFSQVASQLGPLLANLGTTLGQIAGAVIPMITQAIAAFMPVISQVIQTVMSIVSTVLPVVINLINQLLPVIQQIVSVIAQLWAALMPIIANLVSTLLPVIQNIIKAVMNIVTAVAPAIIGVIQMIITIIQALLPVITSIISVVANVVGTVITFIGTIITVIANVIAVIMGIISPIVSFIAMIISNIFAAISPIIAFVSNVFSTVFTVISGVFNNILNFISGIWNTIGGIISGISSVVSQVFNTIASTVSRIMASVGQTISGVFQGIQNAWNGLTGFVSGVFDGISSAVQVLVNQVKGFVNGVIGGVNAAIGLINKIPGVSIGKIPELRYGTKKWQGGFAMMNEGGRGEIVHLPNGSQVIPHDISAMYAKQAAKESARNAKSFELPKVTAEVALGIGQRMTTGTSNVSNYYTTNNNGLEKDPNTTIYLNIEKADLSSDRGIEQTSEQLAILTERQIRGRLA